MGCTYELLQGNRVSLTPMNGFRMLSSYKLVVNPGVKSTAGVLLSAGRVCMIETRMDDTDKFERISDEELLTLVQKQTFRYFWDFGHEYSGMARERQVVVIRSRNPRGSRLDRPGCGGGSESMEG